MQLARHFAEAGVAAKAVAYLRQAGDQAAERYAHVEALEAYGRALELAENTEERYALVLAREQVHGVRGDREAQRRDLETLEDLTVSGDAGRRAEVMLRQAQLAEVTGNFAGAIAVAQEAVRLAQATHDLPRQAVGQRVWGGALTRQGNIGDARGHLEQARGISQELGDR